MINRIRRILDNAHFAKHKTDVDIDISKPSYENAMAVEELKQDAISYAITHVIDDVVKIKQNYPDGTTNSKIEADVDIVVMSGKDFRELEKLLDGLHEIWIQEEYQKFEKKKSQESYA